MYFILQLFFCLYLSCVLFHFSLCLFFPCVSFVILQTDTTLATICFGFCGLTISMCTFCPSLEHSSCAPLSTEHNGATAITQNYFWFTKPLDICIISMISFRRIAAACLLKSFGSRNCVGSRSFNWVLPTWIFLLELNG